jgi:acyl-CoA thioesterase I
MSVTTPMTSDDEGPGVGAVLGASLGASLVVACDAVVASDGAVLAPFVHAPATIAMLASNDSPMERVRMCPPPGSISPLAVRRSAWTRGPTSVAYLIWRLSHGHRSDVALARATGQSLADRSGMLRRMRFVPLGDSYTIGTAVTATDAWPSQLVHRLAASGSRGAAGQPLELVANPAVNGFTTRDVIAVELPQLASFQPELCSILIGTNDVIQGIGDDEYRDNLERILDAMVVATGPGRAFGVTSPDYTVTPAGGEYGDPRVRSAQLGARNALFVEVLKARAIPVIDIHDLSLGAGEDRSLVARDGLHPSGRQYALWVDRIAPVVEALLRVGTA